MTDSPTIPSSKRALAATRPARMSPLAVLPVFMNLAGKRVVVAGAGEGMVWKAELVAAAGAHVDVYTTECSDELAELAAAPPAGSVHVHGRAWQGSDFMGAACAIGAIGEADEAERFAAEAARAGLPVNVVDTPGFGSFAFGTIINRNPVTIGISTAGSAPVVGQAIRGRIEAMLNPALALWVARAAALRDAIKARLPMGAARRDLWRRFADVALDAHRAPADGDIERLLDASAPMPAAGSVVIVGAGPGDPGLLTLRGLRALQSADAIVYDRLVGREILELGRREAVRILAGKTGGGPSCRQSDINERIVALASDGKRVVRLKGGDPMIFGRANEEIAACRSAGVHVEVIPGVSAALGAAAELQRSLTDRRLARRVQFVTGHAHDGRAPDHDWARLADPWTTTVFYMGARTMGEMMPRLIAAGLAEETPAIVVTGATTAESRHIETTAGGLVAALAGIEDGQPCLILIGRAMGEGAVMAHAAGLATPGI